MKTPSPGNGEGAERCLSGDRTLSKSRCKSPPLIVIDGCTVRIVGGYWEKDVPPRRQGFAWPDDARAYAERLSAERGWPIEAIRGG